MPYASTLCLYSPTYYIPITYGPDFTLEMK